MAVNFSVPKSVPRATMMIDTFLGADFTNSPANVDETKSPNCVNMIRDVPGKVRKRMGYEKLDSFDGAINGCHFMRGGEVLIHAGTKLYGADSHEVMYEGLEDAISKSWQFGERLYILDGKKLLAYDQKDGVRPVEDIAYIPTLTIGKEPKGGGTQYEDLNLLQPGFEELFAGTSTAKEFQLTFGGLDEKAVEASVLDKDGNWVKKEENKDFTVNRETGVVSFSEAPGTSPVTGEDNISIIAYRTVEGYADRINKCTIGIRFGVNGAQDRLFLSGNPDFISYDWYSQQWDPTYFPDTGYSNLGSSASAIVGYSIISNYLATHKDEMESDQTIILRQGDLIENKPAFRIVNSLQGSGAIAKNSFAYLATEPVFLTRNGVYAVTAQDVTGEKYAQRRSFYLNGKLLEEINLENAYACMYNDMYWLCVNGNVYVLDGLQAIRTDEADPYATRQYVGFYLTNIPAKCMWVNDGKLYFGSTDGHVYKFFEDKHALTSYSDDGEPIHAVWETPDYEGKLFYKNKSFRYLAIKLGTSVATSVNVSAMKEGIWKLLFGSGSVARYFTFSNFSFAKFTFSCNKTEASFANKINIKKVDKSRFKFENDELEEPFSLYSIAVEYQENGNYKRR